LDKNEESENRKTLVGYRTDDSFFRCFQFEDISFGNVKPHRESKRGWKGYKKKYRDFIPEEAIVPQKKAEKLYLKLPVELTRDEKHQEKADNKWLLGYDEVSKWLLFFPYQPDYSKSRNIYDVLDEDGKEMSTYLDPRMPALNETITITALPPVEDNQRNLYFKKIMLWPEYIYTKYDSDNNYFFFLLPSFFLRSKVDYVRRIQVNIPIFRCFFDDLGNLFYHRLLYKFPPWVLRLPKLKSEFYRDLTELARKLDKAGSNP
jgi:hypothetical protein